MVGARVKSDGAGVVVEGPCKENLVLERYKIIYLDNCLYVWFGNFMVH